jgi:ribosome-binding factor A
MANPRTIAKLESRILERAASCLQFEVSDPRASFITVTRVKLSSDLQSGRIYYSVLGTEGDKSKAAHMLESAAGFLQRQIARVLQLRRMPRLNWVFDDSLERADDMAKLIREARERDRAINPKVDEANAPEAGESEETVDEEEEGEVDELEGEGGEDDDVELG